MAFFDGTDGTSKFDVLKVIVEEYNKISNTLEVTASAHSGLEVRELPRKTQPYFWALPNPPRPPVQAIWATFSHLTKCQNLFARGFPPRQCPKKGVFFGKPSLSITAF